MELELGLLLVCAVIVGYSAAEKGFSESNTFTSCLYLGQLSRKLTCLPASAVPSCQEEPTRRPAS